MIMGSAQAGATPNRGILRDHGALTPIGGYLFTGPTARAWPGWGRGVRRVALTSAARGWLAWLSHGVRIAGHRGEVRLKRGLPSSK